MCGERALSFIMASFLGSAWSTVNNALESDAWRAVKDGANTVTTAAAATVSAVAAQVEEKTSDDTAPLHLLPEAAAPCINRIAEIRDCRKEA